MIAAVVHCIFCVVCYYYFVEKIWYIWSKALGEKAHEESKIANQVAIVRTLIVMCYIITNLFIIAGIVRHW